MRASITHLASQSFLFLMLLGSLGTPGAWASEGLAGDRSATCLVHWQRKSFEPGQWPVELPARGQALISRWRGWAQEMGYRMDFDADMRVMTLSSSAHNRSVCKEDKLVERTLEAFDRRLSAPQIDHRGSDEGLVEKHQEAPVVLLRLHNRADYLTVLDFLSSTHPELESWAQDVESAPGFILDEPLCAAWIESGVQRDGWRPDNELVHRLASTLCQSRFGSVPHWLERGVAWDVEFDVQHSIHCFPNRTGDYGRNQHREWEQQLKNLWGKRTHSALALEDMALWEQGTYDETYASMAWGLVRFLQEYREESLAPILHDLGVYQDNQTRRVSPSGAKVPTPATVTESVLRRYTGSQTLAEVTEFFQRGNRYFPSR
jgi:hypothetical protein